MRNDRVAADFCLNHRAQQVLDQKFVEFTGLSLSVLMEQAALAVTETIREKMMELSPNQAWPVIFLCGSGQNAGDAWASARQLAAYGYPVAVVDLARDKTLAQEAEANRKAAQQLGVSCIPLADFLDLSECLSDCLLTPNGQPDKFFLVDGIFGTGFQADRPLKSPYVEVFHKLNALRSSGSKVLAIDLPSGLDCDTGQVSEPVVVADYTVSFVAPKLGIMAAPGYSYCGEVIVHPISMGRSWLDQVLSQAGIDCVSLVNRALVCRLQGRLHPLDHKGVRGKALLIAGSEDMAGALFLSARACLATGVGYLKIVNSPELLHNVNRGLPQCLTSQHSFAQATETENREFLTWADCVAIGPGSGNYAELESALEACLKYAKKLVIDADALNCLANKPSLCALLRTRQDDCLLTPHPGEYRRLLADQASLLNQDRQEAARVLAEDLDAYVLLKGARTVLAKPRRDQQVWINCSGNPALAKAGSGDVLTGLALGYMSQAQQLSCQDGDSFFLSGLKACYIHGLLADLAVEGRPGSSLAIDHLIDYLPAVHRYLGWDQNNC